MPGLPERGSEGEAGGVRIRIVIYGVTTLAEALLAISVWGPPKP